MKSGIFEVQRRGNLADSDPRLDSRKNSRANWSYGNAILPSTQVAALEELYAFQDAAIHLDFLHAEIGD